MTSVQVDDAKGTTTDDDSIEADGAMLLKLRLGVKVKEGLELDGIGLSKTSPMARSLKEHVNGAIQVMYYLLRLELVKETALVETEGIKQVKSCRSVYPTRD
ncbi:hypothetical protein Tco_0981474 [Tanacetum coccineum]